MLANRNPALCALCKGVRHLCGAKICPILAKRILIQQDRVGKILNKTELAGISEWILVGEYGYPRVRIGVLSAVEGIHPWSPETWAEKKLDFSEILKARALSIYPFRRQYIRKVPDLSDPVGEATASIKPVSIDLALKKTPKIHLKLDSEIPPFGGSAPLKRLELEESPKIPRRIESALAEDLKATQAVEILRRWGASIYYIEKVFSAGLLGRKPLRRLVPTRWGITAVDSIIGNAALKEIRGSSSFGTTRLHYWEYLGNKYYLVVIPSDYWFMEMFEIWLPESFWVGYAPSPVVIQIYEGPDGKPNKIDGGYYAIRTSVLEWLQKNNRVAMILAIRIITPAYIAPVGSWQIRESVRLALSSKPIAEGDLDEILGLLENLETIVKNINMRSKSKLLKQRRIRPITDYFY